MTIASTLLGLILLLQTGQPASPKLTARMLAAHQSVQPGGQTELLIEYAASTPWYLYHPVVLDTGLPTTVEFTTPPGVTIGALRFPPPKLGQTAGLEYLAQAGTIRALAPLTVAESIAPGQSLQITAKISGLACIEMCVPVETTVTLELPVAAAAGPAADTDLFSQARAALTPTFADAPYLKGSELRISKDTIGIDEPAELVAVIRVASNHHIWDRNPDVQTLIGSRLLVEHAPGLELASEEEQVWPDPHVRDIPGIGKVREQSGEVTVRVPFKIADARFPSGPVTIRVLLRYQACNEDGQCFPPEFAAGMVRFVADTPNPPIAAATERPADTPAVEPRQTTADTPPNLLIVLVFGFLGGLILNVMPCVLPVISIKIISFMQQGGEDPKRVLRLGLAFCAGIMVWFWLFAALSTTGHLPLQYPSVVIGVGAVLFVFALNLFGVFEVILPGRAAGKLDQVANREGYSGAFFKGFLATLLGTACTAPFLAGALVYAASQPALIGLLVFTAAGLGMASPYLLLSAKPAWMKFIPKPGGWMVVFKQAMGFVLLGTAVWLLYILGRQIGADGVVWTIAFWGFLALAVWLIGKISPLWSSGPRLAIWISAAAIAVFGYWFSYHLMYEPRETRLASVDVNTIVRHVAEADWDDGIPWAPYAEGVAEELARAGYTVYVDYTATWCATCLTNKVVVLETGAIRAQMQAMGVIPIEADFTNRDARMLADIKRFGRPSVPLNLIYPAERPEDVITLPVILTPGIVSTRLEEAGPSSKKLELVRRDE